MSVVRDGTVCKVTFEDDSWKDAAADVFSVVDGATPFYSAGTWLVDGKNTLRSGAIGNSGTSETTVTVVFQEEGKINLSCAVSSERNYDKLHVLIDGTEKINISGTVNFTEYEFDVAAGTHTIIFRYTKDGSGSSGNDAGAIGYLQFTGVALPYEIRYLMCDFEGKVYTVENDQVKEVPELEKMNLATKAVFQEYGFEEVPSSEQITSLTKPVLYRWCEENIARLHVEATATPSAQTIHAVADMSHETIVGILSMTSVFNGNVTISYSYDGTEYTDPVLMSEFLQTDVDALYAGAVNKKIYFKIVLGDTEASLTNFVISYKNA